MLAQALGLVNCKSGLPEKLLRRSPLDISFLALRWIPGELWKRKWKLLNCIGITLGLCRDSGKENGNYYLELWGLYMSYVGLYRDLRFRV